MCFTKNLGLKPRLSKATFDFELEIWYYTNARSLEGSRATQNWVFPNYNAQASAT
jgi:hypothetical protein